LEFTGLCDKVARPTESCPDIDASIAGLNDVKADLPKLLDERAAAEKLGVKPSTL
jgi:hypothetical protein